ncbi:hypothetical protein K1719_042886 [Acacia pycnantha]|nr:hypothetical protein K1719_042886 [Acacia pycnantha]
MHAIKSFEDTCTNLRIAARMKREIDDDRPRVNQGKFSTFIKPMSGIAKPSGFNSRSTRTFSKKSRGQKSGSRLSYFQKRQGQKSHVEGSQQSRRETAMSAPSVNGPCPKCGKSHGGQCWQCYKCHQYGHTMRYYPELQQQQTNRNGRPTIPGRLREMGGACCSPPKETERSDPQPSFNNPRASEEPVLPSSDRGSASASSGGPRVDANLETSTPVPSSSDTMAITQTLLRTREISDNKTNASLQSTNPNSVEDIASSSGAHGDLEETEPDSADDSKNELQNVEEPVNLAEENDGCPICLEVFSSAFGSLATRNVKNGVEVKLQRNALSVLEHPTGNEEDDLDYDYSSSGSEIHEKDNDFSASIEFHKPSKPRVRHTKPYVHSISAKQSNHASYREVHSILAPHPRVNLANMGTESHIAGITNF